MINDRTKHGTVCLFLYWVVGQLCLRTAKSVGAGVAGKPQLFNTLF